MQRMWQWIRDKKTHTIRKWRSTMVGGSGAGGDGERLYDSALGLPQSQLRPIGGSDQALSRAQTEKLQRRANRQSKKQQRYSSIRANGSSNSGANVRDGYHELEPPPTRNGFDDEPYALPVAPAPPVYFDCSPESDPSYQNYDDLYETSYSGFPDNNYLYSDDFAAGPSSTPQDVEENCSFDESPTQQQQQQQLEVPKLVSVLRRPSNEALLPEATPPGSVRTKRKLRFNIPQVSLTSPENSDAYTTPLLAGEEATVEPVHNDPLGSFGTFTVSDAAMASGSTTALAVGLAAVAISPQSCSPSKTVDLGGVLHAGDEEKPADHTPRRSVTDVERRRMSLAAQRRQSTVQLVQSVSGRRTSTTLIPLTMAQIHLIRSLWRQVYVSKGPTVIGQTIIHRLFFKVPKTKDQFRRCPLPRQFPNHDSFAKAHCKAMGELVDRVVENLDNLEAITPDLERVGRIHAQVLRGELSSKLWNSVAETFIDCTLEWGDKRCRSETVRKAWALIIAFLIEKIKAGHLEQRKQMLTMRPTLAVLDRAEISGSMRVT